MSLKLNTILLNADKKKTAVIGSSGFLGRHIVAGLLKSGGEVTCVYNKNNYHIAGCQQLQIDDFLTSTDQYDNIVFAAGNYLNTHEELVALNSDLLRSISIKYRESRLLYISSVNVYGVHSDIINENSSFNSPLLYGRSKLVGEFIAASFKSFAIIRLTYLYGPNLNNKSFLPFIIEQALTNGKITLMGHGERSQDYLFVEDAAELCLKALEANENNIYLGASGLSYSNLQIAEAICNNLPNCTIDFKGEEKGVSFFFDPKLTMQTLNWQPQIDINEGIRKCLA